MVPARARIAWVAAPLLFLSVFYAIPLLYLVVYALGLSDSRGLGTLLGEILASEYHRERVLFTYAQAFLSTLATLLLGIPLAYLFAFKRVPMRGTLQALLIVPFVLPALVVALGFQAFLGPNSPIAPDTGADWMTRIGPFAAIAIAHAFYNVGLVCRLVSDFWNRVPQDLLEGARSLGASRAQLLLRVLLPIALPAILGSAALVFVFSATSFALILILGERRVGTLETLIAEEGTGFRPEYDLAAALGLLQLLTMLAALSLYAALHRRGSAWFRPRLETNHDPMPLWGWPVLGAALVLVLGPLLSLLRAALRHDGGYNLDAFRLVWSDAYPLGPYGSIDVFRNSFQFGLIAILLALPLALALAFAFRGIRARYAVLESLFLVPLGSSAVLLGLGYLIAFDGSPLLDLRSSPARIAIAHALVAIPFASRILAPSVDALDPNLRAAARSLGATARQALARIELPLLRPALVAAAAFAFATSLGEFGATFLLRRPEFTTIPLAIYDAYSRPGEVYRSQAEALSILLLAVAFAGFVLLERVHRRQRGSLP